MGKTFLTRKPAPKPAPPTPYELIEPEVVHLKKGYSIRYGAKNPYKHQLWVAVLGFGGLMWLYLMDPVLHAWYKGEAANAYVYLHNYGSVQEAESLAACQILSPDEVQVLNQRHGAFQDYYSSPRAATEKADRIIQYLAGVRELHAGHYETLDPVGRMRWLLFIRTGLILPTAWGFLDPSVTR